MNIERRNFLRALLSAGGAALTFSALPSLVGKAAGAPKETDAEVVLVRDGWPASTIVAAKNPSRAARLAIEELNHHIEMISGARLPISYGGEGVKGSVVLVGESEQTRRFGYESSDFEREEFIVETRAGALLLMGFDGEERGEIDYTGAGTWGSFSFTKPVGSLYAVYEFLEKCCGVRWYLPGQDWEIVPEARTIAFSGVRIKRRPWTRYRQMSDLKMPEDPAFWNVRDKDETVKQRPLFRRETELYRLRLRIGGEFFPTFHSFNRWPARFRKIHPEYFALGCPLDGRPVRSQVNFSSQAAADQVVRDIRDYLVGKRLDENGESLYPTEMEGVFPVIPNDNMCWSKDPESLSMVLLSPGREVGVLRRTGYSFNTDRASYYVFQFVNRVAREIGRTHPHVIIGALAYGDYFFPPKGLAIEPNVAVMVCKQQVKLRTRRDDEAYYGALSEWRALVRRLYVWEYYNFPQWKRMNVFPGIVPRRIGDDMEFLKSLPIDGEFIEINVARGFPPFERWLVNPAMEHLNYYFTLKLLDDPAFTMDSLLDEYYALFYGPAAEPVKEFFTVIEDAFMNQKCYRPGHLDSRQSWSCYATPQLMKRLSAFIEGARAAAAGKGSYVRRVGLVKRGVYDFMTHHRARKDFIKD